MYITYHKEIEKPEEVNTLFPHKCFSNGVKAFLKGEDIHQTFYFIKGNTNHLYIYLFNGDMIDCEFP